MATLPVVRSNSVNVDASWWNDILTYLIAISGLTTFVETRASIPASQAATNITGETVDGATYTSALYQFEVMRGTTVFASGSIYLQYLNSTWRVADVGYVGEDHGLTFSVSQAGSVGQLKMAVAAGSTGTIKFKKLLQGV